MKDSTLANDPIVIGQVSGVFGVHGWVKVFSNTEPRENILSYDPWLVKDKTTEAGKAVWQSFSFIKGRKQGKTIVAQLKGIDCRDKAHALIGCDVAIKGQQLKKLEENEFYWRELKGLKIINCDGEELGLVKEMIATGANDVMVVTLAAKRAEASKETELLIPYLMDSVIKKVDLEKGLIQVDWEDWDEKFD